MPNLGIKDEQVVFGRVETTCHKLPIYLQIGASSGLLNPKLTTPGDGPKLVVRFGTPGLLLLSVWAGVSVGERQSVLCGIRQEGFAYLGLDIPVESLSKLREIIRGVTNPN